MDLGIISTRYAKALYAYASDIKEEDRLYEEMKTLANSFASFKSLFKVMENPTISPQEKQKLLTVAGGISVSKAFQSMLQLIETNKRETYILSIALMYQQIYRKQKGIVIAKLITTESLSQKEEENVRNLVSKNTDGKKVDLITQIDADLLGGFILKVESKQLDASIRSQLNKIKMKLIED